MNHQEARQSTEGILSVLRGIYGVTNVRQVPNGSMLKVEITRPAGKFALRWEDMPCKAKSVQEAPQDLAPGGKKINVYRCRGILMPEVFIGIMVSGHEQYLQLDISSALGRELAFKTKQLRQATDVDEMQREVISDLAAAEGEDWRAVGR